MNGEPHALPSVGVARVCHPSSMSRSSLEDSSGYYSSALHQIREKTSTTPLKHNYELEGRDLRERQVKNVRVVIFVPDLTSIQPMHRSDPLRHTSPTTRISTYQMCRQACTGRMSASSAIISSMRVASRNNKHYGSSNKQPLSLHRNPTCCRLMDRYRVSSIVRFYYSIILARGPS